MVLSLPLPDESDKYLFNPSNAEATFVHKAQGCKDFVKHLNPVMLVFFG